MAIIKIKKERGFTTVTNDIMQNKHISFAAKGLLCELLSLPSNWVVHQSSFIREGCKKDFLSKLFKELYEGGYLDIIKTRNKDGKIVRNEWIVYENGGRSAIMTPKSADSPKVAPTACGKTAPIKENINNNKNISIKENKKEKIFIYDDHFLIFYRAYPKVGRKDKAKTYEYYQKKRCKSGLDEPVFCGKLIKAIEAQAHERKLKEQCGITNYFWKNVKTWVNNESWDDDILTEEEVKSSVRPIVGRRVNAQTANECLQSVKDQYGF